MSSPQLSIQLYTVRDALAADLDATLHRLAEQGFNNVEAFDFVGKADRMRAALDGAGLRAPSGHASFLSEQLVPGAAPIAPPDLGAVLDDAAKVGIHTLIDPYVPAERWRDLDEIERTAERINTLADRAAQWGIRLGYHNHSQEFHHEIDGGSALEAFAARLDPRVVLEVDVYWAAIGGQDVAALLPRLGDRVRFLHAKDGIIGADPFHPDTREEVVLDQRPAGQGDLDMPALLGLPRSLEYAVVEFDDYAGDIFHAVSASADYLVSAGVRA